MDKEELFAICKKIASFIVYACNGDQYVPLMEAFRNALSRKEWMDAICALIQYGLAQVDCTDSLKLTQQEWQKVCQFIQHADRDEVRHLHVETMKYIAQLEIKKIHELEKYVANVLVNLEGEEEL